MKNEIQNPTFTNQERTRLVNTSSGWKAETFVKVGFANWVISTYKRYNGTIATHCQISEGGNNGSYSVILDFSASDSAESFYLNPTQGRATEAKIKQVHLKSLADFDAMSERGELPEGEAPIQIGQVVFTDMIRFYDEARRVVYKIEDTTFGTVYHTVTLDGQELRQDSHIKPYSKKFGIGTYYNPGETLEQEKINDLLISAHEATKERQRIEALESEIESIEREEKREYLSQFKRADRGTTTRILKRHIMDNYRVSKVLISTDVFSGGDSMRVTYYAPEEIQELESFIGSFQEGSFNGMEDLYEYDSDKKEIIIDGHILQTYKYVSSSHELAEAPIQVDGTINGSFEIVQYSEKAIALFGDTKPVKDKLKELGGRFNARLTHNGQKTAGWIFRTNLKADLQRLLGL